MRQGVHRRDWKTYARQNEGERSRHPTRPYRDLRRFRTCPQHRTQATLERSKAYWSWLLLLHAQGQRGNLYRLHPNNFNRDCGIEIPEAWMPTIKEHNNRRAVRQRTAEGANHRVKQQGSKSTKQSCWIATNHSRASCFIRSHMTSRPHCLKKTEYVVETSRSTSHVTTSWDKRKNLAFIVIHHDE